MNGNSQSPRGLAAPNSPAPLARVPDRPSSVPTTAAENASVGELFKQLSSDSSHLLRQEINLAKAELMESAGHMARGATKVGIAAGIAIPGLFAFGAFLIIGLGGLLNENYWLSALIVSLAMLGAAALLAKQGIGEFGKASVVPEETMGTLREDARWAKDESHAFRRAFTAPPTRTH